MDGMFPPAGNTQKEGVMFCNINYNIMLYVFCWYGFKVSGTMSCEGISVTERTLVGSWSFVD